MQLVTVDEARPRRLPGAEGVWVFLGADSVIFAILFLTFMQDRQRNPAMFDAARQTLNMNLGGIDTLILLTSSCAVALAVQAIKRDLIAHASRYLLVGVLTGVMFVISKSIEYTQKLTHGITPATDTFYMWYFTLTGIHLTHVLLGTSLLTYVWVNSRRGFYDSARRPVPESVASFWHLVDYLWIVLFPLLYLQKAM